MRFRSDHGLTLMFALSAFAAVAMAWRNSRMPTGRPLEMTQVPEWPELVRIASYAASTSSLKETGRIIVFVQPACSECAAALRTLDTLIKAHPRYQDVGVIHTSHLMPGSSNAVAVGECAQRQGRLIEFLDLPNASGNVRRTTPVSLEVDSAELAACASDSATQALIRRQTLAARQLGFTALPAVLIDGFAVTDRLSFHVLDSAMTHVARRNSRFF